MRNMFFKQKYLNYILEGIKSLEGRVGYDNIKNINLGDYIYLNGKYKCQIIDIKRFSTFGEAIDESNYKLLVPDANSIEEAVKIYEKLFPLWKQTKLGVYIFRIRYPI